MPQNRDPGRGGITQFCLSFVTLVRPCRPWSPLGATRGSQGAPGLKMDAKSTKNQIRNDPKASKSINKWPQILRNYENKIQTHIQKTIPPGHQNFCNPSITQRILNKSAVAGVGRRHWIYIYIYIYTSIYIYIGWMDGWLDGFRQSNLAASAAKFDCGFNSGVAFDIWMIGWI